MKYHATMWHHLFEDEPQLILYEVDMEDNILRMLERYSSGKIEKKIAIEFGLLSLSDQPFSLGESDVISVEFSNFTIEKDQFEHAWNSRIGNKENS